MDKRMFKKEGEELQQYLAFRRKGTRVPAKREKVRIIGKILRKEYKMKVTKIHNDRTIQFSELDIGDIFLLNNGYYMRIETTEDANSVNLNNGNLYDFGMWEKVVLVDAELIVKV